MATPGPGRDPPSRAVFSGGPCPGCEGGGALLILRRSGDGVLLFHCPACGLSFTHEADGSDPEAGRSLAEVAPGGADPATRDEIRAAGLEEHAKLWFGGFHVKPAPPPPKPPRRRSSAPRVRSGEREEQGCGWRGFIAVLLILKLLYHLLRD